MKKPAIPRRITGITREVAYYMAAVRENVEIITGRRGTKIAKFPVGSSPTQAELAAKINELLDLLQE